MDTSTSSMTVALLRGGELVGELHSQAVRNHSIGLLPHIHKLLEAHGIRPRDLQSVAAGIGPGSYTGVRIAVSVAKTLAWSLGLDLLGVSSLEAMALGGAHTLAKEQESRGAQGPAWIVPLMDARRTQAFTAVYEDRGVAGAGQAGPDVWREMMPDGIRLMDAWTEQLLALAAEAGKAAPSQIVFVGETESFAAQIEHFTEQWTTGEVRTLAYRIEAEYIGRLAFPRFANGEKDDVHSFVPNYTQLPEAEVKLLAKAQKGED